MSKIPRPCINCRTATTNGTRCQRCQTRWNKQHPKPPRPHYAGDYQRRARHVRNNATHCWICGEGPRDNDPWTADHVIPGDPGSPLLAAHRTCNSRRGNRTHTPT